MFGKYDASSLATMPMTAFLLKTLKLPKVSFKKMVRDRYKKLLSEKLLENIDSHLNPVLTIDF